MPVNITLEYIHNSLSIDFNASDSSGVDSYFINNTVYFYMNSTSGVLQNNGTINRGNYTLNISVNDTLGNLNYTNFLVIVQDTRFPNITSKGPSGPLSLTIVNMSVITDENASCKYISSTEGNSTVNYTSMNNSFSDMETYHQVNLTLTVGDHLYFVRCIDDLGLVMNVSENISFNTFTPTTSVDSSGGGGGGGRVIGVIGNVTRVASVDLVSPKSISISEKGRVDIPISIKNDGDLSLSDIKVEIIGDLGGAVLSLSKDHISTLSIGSSEEIILTVNIESLENFGTYPKTISVIVESADLHVSEKIYLHIVDPYAKDKTQVDEELSPKGEILELPSPEDSGKRNMFVFIPVIIILLGLISSLVIYSRNNHIANQESDMIEKRLVFVLDELRKSIDQRLVEAARYHYLEIINLFARVNSSSMTYPKKQRYYYEINQLRNELNSIIGKS